MIRRAAGLMLLFGACAGPGGGGLTVPVPYFRPDDRIVVSDFSHVQAVAASPWLVFGATPHGLVIYDRLTRRFRPPVTALDGYPAGRVVAAVIDAGGNGVWLQLWGEADYIHYSVDGRVWTRGSVASEQRAGVLTVEAALARAPLADAMRAAILTDARLRRYQFTAAAASPDRPEIFFGTNGLGLIRVDRQTGEWDVLTYGLVAPGVGAIAPAPGGVWAASTARPAERRGFTWVADDVTTTRIAEGDFPFQSARRLLTVDRDLWLAGEHGVLRIDPATWQFRLIDLPDATSLARAPDGVWVGTTRGLWLVGADERVTAMAPGLAVTSLLAVGETLWVASPNGLFRLTPGRPDLEPRSRRVTIRALARLQDTIIMVTDRELAWSGSPGGGSEWASLPLPPALGIPLAVVPAREGGLWIGGTLGLAHAVLAPAPRVIAIPAPAVPAPVRDLAVDGAYLWAATDSGLVRFALEN